MSLEACIPQMLGRGEITSDKAREMTSIYRELEAQFRLDFGDDAAASMASDATMRALETSALRKKRLALGQMNAQARMLDDMRSFWRGSEEGQPIDPRAATALFDHDGRASYSNVEGRRKAIRARAHALIDGILSDHSRNIVGEVRQPAQLADIVRELFGEDSGNAYARELADAWNGAAEMLRQRFNAAGGAIGKLKHWGVTQLHDNRSIRAAGYDAWREITVPLLDRDRMLDPDTGLRMSPQRFERAIQQVYESIRTEGWDTRLPGGAGARSLANRRADHRFLIFKSADDWMAYQHRFGSGTAFDAMMAYVDGMSRDIAAMEILGPNPAASVRWLKDTLKRTAALAPERSSRAIDRANAGTRQIDRLWNEISGTANQPENRRLALGFGALRSSQTASKLGSATISGLTDTAFQTSARWFNGLRARTVFSDYLRYLRPGSRADQRFAVRAGLIATEWSQHAAAQGRFLNEELTGEVSRRLAEGVLRASGLSRWTAAGRWAFGTEFLGVLTDASTSTLDRLNPALRRALERYGIGATEWEAIRHTPLEMDRGVPWLKPQNVEDRELGDRLLEMIHTETAYAVPEADLRTRALLNAVAPRGTLIGEGLRSAFLFKGFGISLMLMQCRRIMEEAQMGYWSPLKYTLGLTIGTTLMGALALQLKGLSKGQDPRPMNTKGFWGAAALQGGGFGLFGDFLQASQDRYGNGYAQWLAGPMVGDAQSINSAWQRKHPAWAMAKAARQELPGGSLWYARLAFDRMVTDQIQQTLDPNYRDSWRKMEDYAKQQDTRYWWRPGHTEPDRAPQSATGTVH